LSPKNSRGAIWYCGVNVGGWGHYILSLKPVKMSGFQKERKAFADHFEANYV